MDWIEPSNAPLLSCTRITRAVYSNARRRMQYSNIQKNDIKRTVVCGFVTIKGSESHWAYFKVPLEGLAILSNQLNLYSMLMEMLRFNNSYNIFERTNRNGIMNIKDAKNYLEKLISARENYKLKLTLDAPIALRATVNYFSSSNMDYPEISGKFMETMNRFIN